MAGEWHQTTLGSVTEFLSGGTPSKDQAEYWGGSIPWVSAKDMKRLRLDDTEDHVTEKGVANGTRLVPAGTVLLLTRGMTLLNDLPICVVSRPMTFNQDVKALRSKSHIREDFLPYLLLGNKDRLLSLVDLAGHGTGRLNSEELKALDVLLPPVNEQGAIAHILGALDDRIELNRRMSETLEAMARALFKAWFVDFEPVRAKQAARSAGGATGNQKSEGRDPGLPSHLAALFPDRLVETEHGEVPEGWEVRTVADIMEFAYGKALKASERVDGQVPVYGSGGVTGFHDEAHVKGPSIIVGRKGTVGSLYWEDRPFFPIDTVFYVQSKAPLTFCYHHLQTLGLENMNTDAAVPGLNRNNVYRLPVPWSSDELLASFDKIVLGYRRRMRAAGEEIETLAALRDTLLPKLISGDLRVKDAEKFLGAAA